MLILRRWGCSNRFVFDQRETLEVHEFFEVVVLVSLNTDYITTQTAVVNTESLIYI